MTAVRISRGILNYAILQLLCGLINVLLYHVLDIIYYIRITTVDVCTHVT